MEEERPNWAWVGEGRVGRWAVVGRRRKVGRRLRKDLEGLRATKGGGGRAGRGCLAVERGERGGDAAFPFVSSRTAGDDWGERGLEKLGERGVMGGTARRSESWSWKDRRGAGPGEGGVELEEQVGESAEAGDGGRGNWEKKSDCFSKGRGRTRSGSGEGLLGPLSIVRDG